MEGQIFRTRRPLNWAAITDVCGGDIPIGPSVNTLGTTALMPPLLAAGGPAMTNTIEAEAPEPVDIRRIMDEMQAYRAAEEAARRRYVESAVEMVAGLIKRGQNEQTMAILRSLTRPGPFWATRYVPDDRRRS